MHFQLGTRDLIHNRPTIYELASGLICLLLAGARSDCSLGAYGLLLSQTDLNDRPTGKKPGQIADTEASRDG
jgi:hypothetical protein